MHVAEYAFPMMCSALQFGMVCTLLAVAMVKAVYMSVENEDT